VGGKGMSIGKVEMDCILALTFFCINCIILTLLAKFYGDLKKPSFEEVWNCRRYSLSVYTGFFNAVYKLFTKNIDNKSLCESPMGENRRNIVNPCTTNADGICRYVQSGGK
jgi:hypothetical protein